MTPVTLTFAIAGLIWGAVAVLRMPLLYGCAATVFVNACLGYDFFRFQIGSSTWTLDRLMLPLLIAAFLVQRCLGRTARRLPGTSEWLLLALIGWLVVSTFTHDFHRTLFRSASPVWRLTTAYCIPALLYWSVFQAPLTERQVGRLHGAIAWFGVYLAVTGILEITGQWAFVFPWHIADPTAGIHFGRARGPMLSSVSYGLYLAICFLSLWAFRDHWRTPARIALLALAPVYAAAFYFSYTRSIWMGVALGLLTILALTLRGRLRILVLGGLTAAGLLVAATKMDSIVAFQREQDAGQTRESAEMRLSFSYISWQMFQDYPLAGVGFGQFPLAKMPYLADRRVDLPLQAIRPLVHHNTFLCLLTETGAIGLGLFLALLYSWGRDAWQVYRSPAASECARSHGALVLSTLGVYVCQLAFHELSYSTIDNCLIFMLAGMTAALRPAGGRVAEREFVLRASPAGTTALGRVDTKGQYLLGLE